MPTISRNPLMLPRAGLPALLATLLAVLMLASPAHAAKGHVHGQGRLDVAIDRDTLTITLELPLEVAAGFERAPRTDAERAALATAEKQLRDPAPLFITSPAAQCVAQAAEVGMPAVAGDSDNEPHADIDVTQRFRCSNPAALRSIETRLFRSFPRLYRLEARRVGQTGQGTGRLTPKTPALVW